MVVVVVDSNARAADTLCAGIGGGVGDSSLLDDDPSFDDDSYDDDDDEFRSVKSSLVLSFSPFENDQLNIMNSDIFE